jgi:hypothetical protein
MAARQHRPPGNQRTGLLELAKLLPANCVAAEVGSYAGESADIFIGTGKFKLLTCVDPWLNSAPNIAEGEKAFDEVQKRHPEIVKLKEKSIPGAGRFADQSLDFVYIDANHNYEFIKSDIAAWRPKVKPGGIIAGHDYSERFKGVIRAINEIFGQPDKVFIDASWMVRVKSWPVILPARK